MSYRAARGYRGFRAAVLGLAVALVAAALVVTWKQPALSAGATCQTSSPPSGGYTVRVCLTEPVTGLTLTGDVLFKATISVPTGTSPGVSRTEWSINGQHLITDYQSPHEFILSTADFADGTYNIGVDAVLRDGYITPETIITVGFANGNASPPVNTRQYAVPPIQPRGPSEPFVVSAVGDGAGGETNSTNVTNAIVGWNPDLFLYLGDVYEDGTLTEFKNWYGGPGTFYGRLRGVTTPTVGNHEYTANQAPGYFAYWDNIPHYYSYDANGWHFISIDSTSNYGRVTPGTPQYDWLVADLNANRSPCTLVFWHHPLFTIGSESPATRMQQMWDLLAAHHVTLLVTGHDHQYQRWSPMGAGGAVDPAGIVELVAGTGGHSSQSITGSDPRVVKTSKTYGALRMELFGSRADVGYYSAGQSTTLVDASTVSCKGTDGLAPSTPTGLTATPDPAGPVNLGWTASSDNFGVTGYRVYRDGVAVVDLPGTATAWSDTAVSGATRYEYSVDAVDAAGNRSARTAPVAVTTTGPDTTPPTAPGGLSAVPSPTEVLLSWSAATDNVGVTSYEVRRDGVPVTTVDASVTTYADVTVPADEPHTWTVVAGDAAGNIGAESNPVTAVRDTQAPSAPTGLATTQVVPGSITFAWNASTDNTGVAQYLVFRDDLQIATVPGTATGYTDGAPDSTATSHTYRVQAADAAGNLSALSDPLTVVPADSTPPSVPTVQALAVGPNRVDLSWSPSTDDVGVAGYQVYRNGALLTGTTATTFSDTAVLSDTVYAYTVVATDTSGNTSAPSAPASVTTPTPTALTPVADTYARSSNPTTNYGRATTVRVDGDPVTNTYLKFTVSGVSGGVARVRLRLYVTGGSSSGFVVRRVADSSWSETVVNWTNAPAIDGGAPVAASGRTTTGTWVTVDVTPIVTGNGTFTIALTSDGVSSSSYGSRESTTQPQLLVDALS